MRLLVLWTTSIFLYTLVESSPSLSPKNAFSTPWRLAAGCVPPRPVLVSSDDSIFDCGGLHSHGGAIAHGDLSTRRDTPHSNVVLRTLADDVDTSANAARRTSARTHAAQHVPPIRTIFTAEEDAMKEADMSLSLTPAGEAVVKAISSGVAAEPRPDEQFAAGVAAGIMARAVALTKDSESLAW